MKRVLIATLLTMLVVSTMAMPSGEARAADASSELGLVTKKGSFEDARQDLQDAVINAGLKIDYQGAIGKMLERTAADIGATKPIYKNAEFFTFCSAALSRAMMEADPANVGFCPYVMFVYERADKPGEVVVGYRKPPSSSANPAAQKAFAAIENLLQKILKEAAK